MSFEQTGSAVWKIRSSDRPVLMANITHNGRKHRVPDFIIGGGMKCATTSLHHMLGRHPDVFIPDYELKFFSVDDFVQQPEFVYPRGNGEWISYDYERFFDEYLEWYSAFFEPAETNHLIGEDTPTYLAAEHAPQRIANLLPGVKLIFLLRNPVERTYSHYWHWVRSGRAFYSFEDCLRFQTVPLLQRSFYREQLQAYFDRFDASQIKVVLFEQLVKEPEVVFHDVLGFLGLSEAPLAPESSAKNLGSTPRFKKLKLLHNRLMRTFIGYKHTNFLPGNVKDVIPRRWGYIDKILRTVNPMRPVKPKPMGDESRKFLTDYFVRRNAGLSELLGYSLTPYWGKEFENI